MLNSEWDPLGSFADGVTDEYDSCADRVVSLMNRKASGTELAAYLLAAEKELGLSKPNKARAGRVAKLLLAAAPHEISN